MAQMSLEMVIGFIILLVVAGVVIGLVFTNLTPNQVPTKKMELAQMNFKNKCNALCTDTNSIEYCRYYFEGGENKGLDWNGNGIRKELLSVGEVTTWAACEDRIYCFFAVPCDRFGENPIKGCADALCNTYLRKYKGDVSDSNEAVFDKIKNGSCSLPAEEKNNWFLQYFPPDVCGCDCNPWVPQGIGLDGCSFTEMYYNRTCSPKNCTKEKTEKCESVSLTLSDCGYNSTTNSTLCNTNCENRTSHWTNITVTNSTGATANASVGTTSTVGNITFILTPPLVDNQINFTTVPELPTLNEIDKDNWNVTLICSKPEGTITITGVS